MALSVRRDGLRTHASHVAVAVAILIIGIGTLALVWLLARPLSLFFLGIVIAQALMPTVARLESRMPRGLAIALIYGGLVCIFGGLGWLLAPQFIDQVNRLVERAPDLAERAQNLVNRWNEESGGRIGELVSGGFTGGSSVIASLPVTLAQSVLDIFFVIAMSIYWLAAAPRIHRFMLSLFPERRRDDASEIMGELGQATGGFVRGEVIDATIVGILAGGGLWAIGFEYPILGGLISFVGELFPVIGPVLAAVPVTALALLDSPTQALIVLVFYIALQQVEGQILAPNIMRNQTDLPQVLVLFALFAGGAIGGIIGALVAIPLMAAVRVLALRLIIPAIRSWTWGNEQPTGNATESRAE